MHITCSQASIFQQPRKGQAQLQREVFQTVGNQSPSSSEASASPAGTFWKRACFGQNGVQKVPIRRTVGSALITRECRFRAEVACCLNVYKRLFNEVGRFTPASVRGKENAGLGSSGLYPNDRVYQDSRSKYLATMCSAFSMQGVHYQRPWIG